MVSVQYPLKASDSTATVAQRTFTGYVCLGINFLQHHLASQSLDGVTRGESMPAPNTCRFFKKLACQLLFSNYFFRHPLISYFASDCTRTVLCPTTIASRNRRATLIAGVISKGRYSQGCRAPLSTTCVIVTDCQYRRAHAHCSELNFEKRAAYQPPTRYLFL